MKWTSLIARQDFQWWDCVVFCGVVGQGGPVEIPKKPKPMLGQRVSLQTLRAGLHCQGQHPHSSLNTQRQSYMEHSPLCLVFWVRGGTLQTMEKETWTLIQTQIL